MQAIVITQPGGPEVLQMRDVPAPEPGSREILVAVKATAVNRLDLLQRMGHYPAPADVPQDIPGVEYAGIVEKCGSAVKGFSAGDRVFGLIGGGSYAQYVVVHESSVMKMPDNLSFIEAAAIPEAYITAYDAVVLQAGLKEGETLLINAVGSGVGVAAVQIALALGARPLGTARSASKIEPARAIGLEEGFVVQNTEFAQEVLKVTNGRGVDVVLELAGGNYVAESLACMALKGRMMVVGLVAGSKVELDLATLLRRRLQIKGTVLRSRTLEEKAEVTAKFIDAMLPLFASGRIKPAVDRVFPLSQASEAHRLVARNENFGKVVFDLSL